MDALRAAVVQLLKLNPNHGLDDIALAEEVMDHRASDLTRQRLIAAGFKRSERLRAMVDKLGHPQQFGDDRHPVDHALDILERVLFSDNQST